MSEYLVEGILPSAEVHLLAGPSGSGKTRWLIPALLDWEQGLPFLGRKSYPCKWSYVSSDRSLVSIKRTLRTMNIDIRRMNVIPAWNGRMSYAALLDAIHEEGPEMVVIESFGSFLPPPGNGAQVKDFLQRTYRELCDKGITVIGIVESPKSKHYEKYDNPRQRVSGAAAWAHFTETIFLVEQMDVKEMKNRDRILYVLPRNEAESTNILRLDANKHFRPVSGSFGLQVVDK